MINDIRVKVCGITSLADAEAAAKLGADYLGFILYPKSPRYLPLEKFQSMLPSLPACKKIGVVVEPSLEELARVRDAGFDCVQLHFPNETSFIDAMAWLDVVPADRLWFAPRIPPHKSLDLMYTSMTDTLLLDTYHPHMHGGTGKTGDWAEFAHLQAKYCKVTWVLAGGLKPDNIVTAVHESKAKLVDVSSGVEASPGVKDHAKLAAFFAALQTIKPKHHGSHHSHGHASHAHHGHGHHGHGSHHSHGGGGAASGHA